MTEKQDIRWKQRFHNYKKAIALLEEIMTQKLIAHHAVIDSIVVTEGEVVQDVEENAAVSAKKRSAGSKRCSNKRLPDSGYQFKYPSFREGYGEMLARLIP